MTTIYNVPIFKIGSHNGHNYSVKDLQVMAENYELLKTENPDFQMPIKIGHDGGSSDEKPAVGWMDNVRLAGDFLVADFKEMLPEILNELKKKTYKNRSIELITKYVNSAGEKLGYVIKGIALLGGSFPAVNLPDIKFHLVPDFVLNFGQGQESVNIEFGSLDNESQNEAIAFEATEIQTLIFGKNKFNKEAAIGWANMHKFKADKVDETEDSFRLRQKEPGDFKDGSFRTIEIEMGITAVIGKLLTESKSDKQEVKMSIDEMEAVNKKEDEINLAEEKKLPEKTEQEIKEFSFLEEVKKFSSEPDRLVAFFREQQASKERYDSEVEKMIAEKRVRERKDLSEFANVLLEEDKILPAEKPFVETLLFNLNNEVEVEFSYSEYNLKDKKSLLAIFKTFLSNLPKRGVLGQAGSSKLVLGWKQGLQEFAFSKGYKETLEVMDSKTYAKVYSEHKKLRPDLYEGGDE